MHKPNNKVLGQVGTKWCVDLIMWATQLHLIHMAQTQVGRRYQFSLIVYYVIGGKFYIEMIKSLKTTNYKYWKWSNYEYQYLASSQLMHTNFG
jgi:hypothetical protein